MDTNKLNESVMEKTPEEAQNSYNHRDWAKAISEKYKVPVEDAIRLYCYIRDLYVKYYNDKEFERLERRLEKIRNSWLRFKIATIRCNVRIFIDSLYEDSWLQDIYYWLYRVCYQNITIRLYERKMRNQRRKRGYSDSDWQNLEVWMSTVLSEAIEHLADNLSGTPGRIEAIMKKKSPLTYKGTPDEETSEKEWKRRHEWWKNHLKKIAFCLRESNEETCSRQNEIELKYKFNWKRSDKWPYYYEMDDEDCSPEFKERRAEYMKQEMALEKYRYNQFKKAFTMLAELHGMLWD